MESASGVVNSNACLTHGIVPFIRVFGKKSAFPLPYRTATVTPPRRFVVTTSSILTKYDSLYRVEGFSLSPSTCVEYGIEYRGFGQDIVEELAKYAGVPVWNGLTNEFHPTQILADFLTMMEHTDKPLNQVTFAYCGDARF